MDDRVKNLGALPVGFWHKMDDILSQLTDIYPTDDIYTLIHYLAQNKILPRYWITFVRHTTDEELRSAILKMGVKDHQIIFLYCLVYIIDNLHKVNWDDKDRTRAWLELLESIMPADQRTLVKEKVEETVWSIRDAQLTSKDYKLFNGDDVRGFAIVIIPIMIQTVGTVLTYKTLDEFWASCIGSLLYAIFYTVFTEVYSSDRYHDHQLIKAFWKEIFPVVEQMAINDMAVNQKAKRLEEEVDAEVDTEAIDLEILIDQDGLNYSSES